MMMMIPAFYYTNTLT